MRRNGRSQPAPIRVSLRLELPQAGFVPGQSRCVQLQSKHPLSACTASLLVLEARKTAPRTPRRFAFVVILATARCPGRSASFTPAQHTLRHTIASTSPPDMWRA